jgi:vacuolar-type H+-ATPase subunit I/STV1
MDEFRTFLRVLMIVLVAAGIAAGVIGAVIANPALIIVGAILMSIPLILKVINNMILEEWIAVMIESIGLAVITGLYVWSLSLASSVAANALNRPVLWVVVGVGIILLLFTFPAFRED